MALADTADHISIIEANKLGMSGLVRKAEAGREQIVLRNNKPAAAVVSSERFEQLLNVHDDLLDVLLAVARMQTTGPERYSLDDVLALFGYTREHLAQLDE